MGIDKKGVIRGLKMVEKKEKIVMIGIKEKKVVDEIK